MEKDMEKRKAAEEIFVRANAKWEKKQNKVALELFLQAAQLGNASAQHNVGYFYDEGIGTKKNHGRALAWYKKAWRSDRQTGTCINIAKLYESNGQERLAVAWWKKAVARRDGDAALDLAKYYLQSGGMRDVRKAEALLKLVGTTRATEAARREATKLLRSTAASARS
jgi:TPR repeat protein